MPNELFIKLVIDGKEGNRTLEATVDNLSDVREEEKKSQQVEIEKQRLKIQTLQLTKEQAISDEKRIQTLIAFRTIQGKDNDLLIERLRRTREVVAANEYLDKSNQKVAASTEKISNTSGSALYTLSNLGRILQDAAYGANAIANNISPATEGVARLAGQAGGASGAIMAIVSAIFSPAGMLIALSSLATYFLSGTSSAKGMKDEIASLNDEMDEFRQKSIFDLKDQIQWLESINLQLTEQNRQLDNGAKIMKGNKDITLEVYKNNAETIRANEDTLKRLKSASVDVIEKEKEKNSLDLDALKNKNKELEIETSINDKYDIRRELAKNSFEFEANKVASEKGKTEEEKTEEIAQLIIKRNLEIRKIEQEESDDYNERFKKTEKERQDLKKELDAIDTRSEENARRKREKLEEQHQKNIQKIIRDSNDQLKDIREDAIQKMEKQNVDFGKVFAVVGATMGSSIAEAVGKSEPEFKGALKGVLRLVIDFAEKLLLEAEAIAAIRASFGDFSAAIIIASAIGLLEYAKVAVNNWRKGNVGYTGDGRYSESAGDGYHREETIISAEDTKRVGYKNIQKFIEMGTPEANKKITASVAGSSSKPGIILDQPIVVKIDSEEVFKANRKGELKFNARRLL